jgi:hypothetical protein
MLISFHPKNGIKQNIGRFINPTFDFKGAVKKVVENLLGSPAEFMGDHRFRQITKCMI